MTDPNGGRVNAEGTEQRGDAPQEQHDEASGQGASTKHSAGQGFIAAVREFVVVVVMAVGLSFVVKTWLVQAFYIPSESMENTLVVNDRVIVNKLTPDLMDLHRGDIVVFSDPDHWLPPAVARERGPVLDTIRSGLIFVGLLPDPADGHLIKRIIGMPGDHVVCCDDNGRLTVNGAPLTEPYLKPGSVPSTVKFDITVPAGKVWLMGDNRGDSGDSRFHDASGDGSDGSVPISMVTGRAVALVWPLNRLSWLSAHADTFTEVPAPTTGSSPSQSASPSDSSSDSSTTTP